MDVESLAKQLILQNMTPEQQKAVLESIRQSLQKTRELKKQKVGENAQLVVQALKKIEADIRAKYDDLGNKIEQRVARIKDGKDGKDGKNGANGRDGRDGMSGPMGPKGKDGLNGRDGKDGEDGISVTDAHIDFDGSLIISLSSGRTINVGEVVAPDLTEKIKIIANGGGTSQTVLDTLASLQTQINNLIPSQTGNNGKFLTTNGSSLSWASVPGALTYKGTWNASTNTPTLASGVGFSGDYYVVATAGSTNLDGITDWLIGDWLLFNGATWQKIDQTNTVTSVNGQTGAVSLTTTNINEGTNLYYLDSRTRQALSAGTGITYSNTTGVITNAAPDQVVALTGAGTTSISGTYPNFTITSNDQYQGTVTSVAVSVPTGLTVSGSPITSSGTIAITLTAGYSIPTTSSQTNWDTAYTDRLKWDGGATGLVASTGRTSLGATTVGANFFTLTNPSAITFPRINADNSVSTLDAATFRTAIGAGTGNGTVTSVAQTFTGGLISVAGSPVTSSGTLALTVAGTSGGVPYFSGAATWASSGVLTANAIVVGGGAGAAPSTITTGTGVVTALGVNTGTAGAFVVNGGALGTPSSGTVTNLTGTASININGTVGATTPNTGAFTSITSTSASGILTRAAANQDGVQIYGRAGGTGNWEVAITPTTLSADRTLTLPDNSGTVLTTGATVTVPQGGTGLTSGTSGGIPYFSSTTAITSSSLLTANAIMVGGGAGAAPSTITTGTGVVTALGVNTGTAGAFVVNGGALGTPSSGTVTNLTGTASININGTVGATTPNTGNFTTVTASADSSFTSTGALLISKGTTAQQPGSPATGMMRYNTTTNQFEGYSGSSPSWSPIGGGASLSNDTSTSSNLYPLFANATTGSPATIYTSNAKYLYKPSTGELKVDAPIAGNGILINSTTVATSYTIASGQNGMSVGPVTVNSGVTVTVSSGQRWLVL